MILVEDLRVAMRDGTLLATELTRPSDGGPFPVMLVRSPYSRAALRTGLDAVALARAGWAVVLQDVRGRYDSGGHFAPFENERDDGADALSWCAEQPWSSGKVVMQGASYVGAAQLLAATTGHPALQAISPAITADQFRENWVYEGGALQLLLALPWALSFTATDPRTSPAKAKQALDLILDVETTLARPHKGHPARTLSPAYDTWLRDDPSYWKRLDPMRSASKVTVPGWHVAGWYDIFCEASLRVHRALCDRAGTARARASQRLIIGPWVHSGLYLESSAEHSFGPHANAFLDGSGIEVLSWLRDAVDGKQVRGGVRAYVMGSQEWRELPEWPPPATSTVLWLDADKGANSDRGDGRLVSEPPGPGTDRYLYDPYHPVPTRGGRILGLVFPQSGPVDQRPVEARDDVLVYTTEPLPADLTVMGAVTADIRFITTGTSADVTVKLVDVYPDGTALNVLDSIRRSVFAAGRAKVVRVEVGSVAQTFLKGHRLRVEVSSSNYPRFDRNSSVAGPIAEVETWRPAVQSVLRGGQNGSKVTLPVV